MLLPVLSHRGSSKAEAPMAWLSSSEHLGPRNPRPPRLAYSDQPPPLPAPAQGGNPPHKHLALPPCSAQEAAPREQTPINYL